MAEVAKANKTTGNDIVKTRVVAAIPCYNTQEHIAEVIAKTKKYVDVVIVIDDGSTDKTAEVAKKAGATVIAHIKNEGYGGAIKSCFAVARTSEADVLVIIDGDGQHNPDEIPRLLDTISLGNADVVIGSRFLDASEKIPMYRKFGIGVITFLWNFGAKVKVSDTQSGFRAYSKTMIQSMNFYENGMSISIEIIEKARMARRKFKEVPVTCSYENNNSNISITAFKQGISVALSVMRIRLKSRFIKV